MTAEQLRNSILQEAISGRLVPHDPNDEPASVILEQTMQERAELLASKEIRKDDLKVSPIEDELPFELPSGWEWVTVDRIAIVKGGKRIPVGKTFSDTPTPYMYIRVTEMKNNTLIDCEHKYISAELRELLKRYIIHSTDIYVTIAGTIGAVGDVPEKFDGMNLTENALKLSHLHVDKKYLIYALSSTFVQEQFKEKTNKVGQPKLAMERVKSTLLPLPPLAEQKRIVAKLEELLPIVEQYGKAQTELDELNAALPSRLRQSVLQEAMQGKLIQQVEGEKPFTVYDEIILRNKQIAVQQKKLKKSDAVTIPIKEEEIPFEIPSNWTWYRLSDLANMYTGDSINVEQKLKYYTNVEGMEYIGTKDVKFNHEVDYKNGVAISDAHRPKFRTAPAGAILLCVEGGSAGRKIATIDRDVCFGNKLCCFDTYYNINSYLYYYLQSPMFKDVFRNSKTGIIGGVSIGTLRQLLVPMPPLAEQQRIVAKIEELFEQITRLSEAK